MTTYYQEPNKDLNNFLAGINAPAKPVVPKPAPAVNFYNPYSQNSFINKNNFLGPAANSTPMMPPLYPPKAVIPGTVASISQPVQNIVQQPVVTRQSGGARTTSSSGTVANKVVAATVPGSTIPVPTTPVGPQVMPAQVPGYSAPAVDPEIARLQAIQEQYNRPQDAESIYQEKLTKQQGEIDAQNNIYNDMLNRSRIQNAPTYARRLGSTASLAVNQGLTGSNVGEGIQRDTEQANIQDQAMQEGLINEKRAQAIAGIKGEIRKSSEATMAANIEANRQGVDARIQRLTVTGPAEKKASARRVLKGLLAAGVDVSKMTDEEKKSYLDGIGISSSDWNAISGEEVASVKKATQEAEKEKLELDKTKAEISNLEKKYDFEGAQKALDRQLEQKKINVQWHNAESARISANKKGADEKPEPTKEMINKKISEAEADGAWGNWSSDERNRFIRNLGGLPSDYEI